MKQDEIIRSPLGREQLVALAREAGMDIDDEASGFGAIITAEPLDLERFAALVAEPWIETNKALANEIIELKKQAEQSQLADASLEPVALVEINNGVPLAWMWNPDFVAKNKDAKTALYASPVRTKDLTDEEILKIVYKDYGHPMSSVDISRAVIAADRKLNKQTKENQE